MKTKINIGDIVMVSQKNDTYDGLVIRKTLRHYFVYHGYERLTVDTTGERYYDKGMKVSKVKKKRCFWKSYSMRQLEKKCDED